MVFFKQGFCILVSGGLGRVGEGLERGWGGGWGAGWGGVGEGLGMTWISILRKPHLKKTINVP